MSRFILMLLIFELKLLYDIKIGKCEMFANETTYQKRTSVIAINKYWSPYYLQD